MMFNGKGSIEAAEKELEQALGDFRRNVQAWSDNELAQPRVVAAGVSHVAWRQLAAWALGCLMVAAIFGGALHLQQSRDLSHRQPAPQVVKQATLPAAETAAAPELTGGSIANAPAQTADEDEHLLADVDSDVSQVVPSAMEPLAQLMETNSNQ